MEKIAKVCQQRFRRKGEQLSSIGQGTKDFCPTYRANSHDQEREESNFRQGHRLIGPKPTRSGGYQISLAPHATAMHKKHRLRVRHTTTTDFALPLGCNPTTFSSNH